MKKEREFCGGVGTPACDTWGETRELARSDRARLVRETRSNMRKGGMRDVVVSGPADWQFVMVDGLGRYDDEPVFFDSFPSRRDIEEAIERSLSINGPRRPVGKIEVCSNDHLQYWESARDRLEGLGSEPLEEWCETVVYTWVPKEE